MGLVDKNVSRISKLYMVCYHAEDIKKLYIIYLAAWNHPLLFDCDFIKPMFVPLKSSVLAP